MACHAIKVNHIGVLTGKVCRNYRMEDSLFCFQHQSITPEEHKSRWFRKFILGSDGKRFLYNYDESKKQRILGDLRDKVIVLTKKDIDMIPARRWFIDIYLLLLEHGHIEISDHGGLYVKALQYLSDFWYLGNNVLMLPFSPLATKIQEILITSSAETLLFFYKMLPTIIKTATFQGDILLQRMISVSAYLSNLEQSKAAKELSWIPFRSELLEEYKEKLGESHLLTNFLREVYLPCFLQLYTTEKQIQKATMDTCKEELIAYCWHPDRFQTWCLDEEEKAENRELFG
jgi:hypothetical protein